MPIFNLTIPVDYPQTPTVSVHEAGELPEYGQVWIWDMFFAATMHELGDTSEAHTLKETLDVWAVNMSSKIYQPFEHVRSKGHTSIVADLTLGEVAGEGVQIEVDVSGGAEDMPKVAVTYGEGVGPKQKAAAVIGLAQYFIDTNELFAKELPIHILAFRKYYGDVKPHTAAESVEEAPLFAIQKALEYFNSIAQGTMQ